MRDKKQCEVYSMLKTLIKLGSNTTNNIETTYNLVATPYLFVFSGGRANSHHSTIKESTKPS